MNLLSSLRGWADVHPTLAAFILFHTVFALFNLLFKPKTSAQYAKLASFSPRLAALLQMMGALGVDPAKVARIFVDKILKSSPALPAIDAELATLGDGPYRTPAKKDASSSTDDDDQGPPTAPSSPSPPVNMRPKAPPVTLAKLPFVAACGVFLVAVFLGGCGLFKQIVPFIPTADQFQCLETEVDKGTPALTIIGKCGFAADALSFVESFILGHAKAKAVEASAVADGGAK